MNKLAAAVVVLFLATACREDRTATACIDAVAAYRKAPDKRKPEAGELAVKASSLCPIACRGGNKEACEADDALTDALCDLEGEVACKRMCDEDKNERACARMKSK